MKKATLVRIDGTRKLLPSQPTLKEAQDLIGGYVEIINVGDNTFLVVDSDGKLRKLKVNMAITREFGRNVYGGYIVGDVIVLEGWDTVKED